MSIAAVVAARAAGGAQKLRRVSCRFAGMVVPGDTVIFSAEEADAPGRLVLKATNQHGDAILTKGMAQFDAA
jgi:acyl dehydratase